MKKRLLAAVMFSGLSFVFLSPIFADTRIALMPLVQEGDEEFCAPLAAEISAKLLLTLYLLDHYDILRIPEEEWNDLGREKIINKYRLEQVIIGKVTVSEEGEVILSFQVYDTEDRKISRELTVSSPDYMEIFNRIDTFIISIIEESIERDFSYGSLTITNDGSADEYWISLDGEEVGRNIRKIPLFPEGTHLLKIYTKTETDINLVDACEFDMFEGECLDYAFTLDAGQEVSTEKKYKLSDGRTMNMTKIQWKEINGSGYMGSPRSLRYTGMGLTLGGTFFLSLGFFMLVLEADTTYTGEENYDTTEGRAYGLGFITIGCGLVIAGIICLILSPVTRNKKLNREFPFSVVPVITARDNGMLTGGISINFRF